MEKHVIRALKYFVTLCVMLTLIICILVAAHLVEGNIETIFVHGYKSLLEIAVFMLAVSAVYPFFGYCKREIVIPGEPSEARRTIEEKAGILGYEASDGVDGEIILRKKSSLARILKLGEDRISLTRTLKGYTADGISRDVIRLCDALN